MNDWQREALSMGWPDWQVASAALFAEGEVECSPRTLRYCEGRFGRVVIPRDPRSAGEACGIVLAHALDIRRAAFELSQGVRPDTGGVLRARYGTCPGCNRHAVLALECCLRCRAERAPEPQPPLEAPACEACADERLEREGIALAPEGPALCIDHHEAALLLALDERPPVPAWLDEALAFGWPRAQLDAIRCRWPEDTVFGVGERELRTESKCGTYRIHRRDDFGAHAEGLATLRTQRLDPCNAPLPMGDEPASEHTNCPHCPACRRAVDAMVARILADPLWSRDEALAAPGTSPAPEPPAPAPSLPDLPSLPQVRPPRQQLSLFG